VGLDIGTTKVSVTIAEPNEHGGLDIVGFGTCPSKGLRKGVVINLDATVDSIKSAVEEAELMAGVAVEKAFVGIAGGHVRGFNSRGVVAIAPRSRDHAGRRGPRAQRAPGPSPSLPTGRSSTSFRRSSWSTTRTGSGIRSG
jgi:hypothetical protein